MRMVSLKHSERKYFSNTDRNPSHSILIRALGFYLGKLVEYVLWVRRVQLEDGESFNRASAESTLVCRLSSNKCSSGYKKSFVVFNALASLKNSL